MFKSMTIAKKVALALGASALILLIVVAFGVARTRRVSEQLTEVVGVRYPGMLLLIRMNDSINSVSRGINGHFILEVASSEKEWGDGVKMIEGAFSRLGDFRKSWEALEHTPEEIGEWQALQEPLNRWIQAAHGTEEGVRAWHELLMAGKRDDPETAVVRARAIDLWRVSRANYVLLSKPLGEAIAANEARAVQQKDGAVTTAQRAVVVLLASGLVGLVLLALTTLGVARNVQVAIRRLIEQSDRATEAVGEGSLAIRAEESRVSPEFRSVLRSLNGAMDAYARPIRLMSDYVAGIANGEIPPRITDEYRGDFDEVKKSLNSCIGTLEALLADTDRLARAAVEGRLSVRADVSVHRGSFRRLLEGVNQTVATLVSHLDSMPVPAMIIDREFGVRYMNGAGARLIGKRPDEVVGKRCFDLLRTGDCRTERCACAMAMRSGQPATRETEARPGDARLQIAYSATPVRDTGGAVIGALEVISDQTEIRTSMSASRRVAEYQGRAAEAVTEALSRLAAGDLGFQMQLEAGDEVTRGAHRAFEAIGSALLQSSAAVRGLTEDVNTLAQAAVEGRLTTRADPSRHQGDFRKIVEGLNRTLDAVVAPIGEAAATLERIAKRDLRARVQGAFRGDHGRVKDAVNASAQALHDALVQVSTAVEQVSSAATQIASSSQAVASGASEQAASLEETSSSIDSVASTTRQAADNAQQAHGLVTSARTAATDGAAAVGELERVMGKIKQSAEGTSQIIKDVSDIAFQTNLLALNAAVEAARAGEAGRGFAVVAEEVRSLALRAKEAAAKTEELIRVSVKQTGEGEVAARLVAGKLKDIVEGIGKVTDIVREITAMAKEQTTGIDQVNKAMVEMDKVTQQNAASAEESSSAASELSGQAEELASMLATFQLEHGTEHKRVGSPAARPAAAGPNGAHKAARGVPAEMAFPLDDAAARDF